MFRVQNQLMFTNVLPDVPPCFVTTFWLFGYKNIQMRAVAVLPGQEHRRRYIRLLCKGKIVIIHHGVWLAKKEHSTNHFEGQLL